MSATKTQICNIALRQLGQYRIESFETENSTEAEMCRDLFNFMRQETLRAHPWNFATQTAELSQTSNTPPDWDYEYELPADCLRVLNIIGVESADPIKFEIRAARSLVCDEDSVEIRYTQDIEDSSLFDSQFVTAFAYRLAAELAAPLTGSLQKEQALQNKFNAFLISAQGTDAQESRLSELERIGQMFIDAR